MDLNSTKTNATQIASSELIRSKPSFNLPHILGNQADFKIIIKIYKKNCKPNKNIKICYKQIYNCQINK